MNEIRSREVSTKSQEEKSRDDAAGGLSPQVIAQIRGEVLGGLPGGCDTSAEPTEKALALVKEATTSEVAALLGTMKAEEVLAVHAFATCLKAGGVSPAFFTLIADALRVPGASR